MESNQIRLSKMLSEDALERVENSCSGTRGGPRVADETSSKDIPITDSGWRLPSGTTLGEFAWQSGFLTPHLWLLPVRESLPRGRWPKALSFYGDGVRKAHSVGGRDRSS